MTDETNLTDSRMTPGNDPPVPPSADERRPRHRFLVETRRVWLSLLMLAVAAPAAIPVTANDNAAVVRPVGSKNGGTPIRLNPAEVNPLPLPNGCLLEAIRFKALHPGDNSGIIVIHLNGVEHAIVAYEKDGKLWSHCTMLGDVSLGLKLSQLHNFERIRSAYRKRFAEKLRKVERGCDTWPVNESPPEDTPAVQVARASRMLDSLRIKNAILVFTKEDGQTIHALLAAMATGVVIYTPELGSVRLEVLDLGQEGAVSFAREHLRFTPVHVRYEDATRILARHDTVSRPVAPGSSFPITEEFAVARGGVAMTTTANPRAAPKREQASK